MLPRSSIYFSRQFVMKPLVLIVCLLFSCDAFAQDEAPWQLRRQELIGQTGEVALPGSVGSLCVFGPKAFPIVTAVHDETTRLPIIAAAEAGAGRVIACAHGGYVEKDHGSSETATLMLRLARWASRKTDGPIRFAILRQNGISATLQRDGHQSVSLDGKVRTEKLTDIDLLILTGAQVTTQNVKPIQQYLAGGGGVIVADAAWVWDGYRKKPEDLLSRDHGPNRLLAPIGIVWTRGMVKRDSATGVKIQSALPNETHALGAIVSLEQDRLKTKQQLEQARVAIEQGFEAIPLKDELLYPRIDRISSKIGIQKLKAGFTQRRGLGDLRQRIAVGKETVMALQSEIERIEASPLADHFPGAVRRSAPRVDRTLTIDTSTPRWHVTGMYAAPGEVVTIRVESLAAGKGLKARVGCHKDRLWHKSTWRRSPEITRTFPIDSATTAIANAFGGMVYVEVPLDCKLGEIKVTINGAVESPVYVHGETTLGQWRSIRRRPGPWAEIGSDKIVFTVPSSKVRDLDRPDLIMEYWEEVMDACADLAMIDHKRASPERFVIDLQISAGYMHAGYPIMAPSNLAGEVLDVETLREKGNWGVFHEIGHNHQEPEWTYDGMSEVTVNLFSMYVYETLHPGAKQHGQVEPESIAKKIADFQRTGQREGPWVNLVPYIQLRREFGWQSFKNVFKEYRELPKSDRPKNDLEKRDQWMVRFSNEVDRDLSPFFRAWKIETSDAAKRQISHLTDWSAN